MRSRIVRTGADERFALTYHRSSRYDGHMGIEQNLAATLDVSGLPEPVVKSLKELVESLRTTVPGTNGPEPTAHRPPLLGRFAHLGISIPEEDIEEAQRQAWSGFPREFPDPK